MFELFKDGLAIVGAGFLAYRAFLVCSHLLKRVVLREQIGKVPR